MKKSSIILLISLSLLASRTNCQESADMMGFHAINQPVIRAQLEFLSSDWMEGRKAGEKGERLSSDYIASMLKLHGVKPWGDRYSATSFSGEPAQLERSYFQNFFLTKSTAGNSHILKLITDDGNSSIIKEFRFGADFSLWPRSSQEIKAPIVFAGYGFKNDKLKVNELTGLDVKGKFILKINGFPAFAVKKLTREELTEARNEFEKYAEQNGAAGIIEFNPSTVTLIRYGAASDPSPSERIPRPSEVYSSYSIAGNREDPGLMRITISSVLADEIFKGTKTDFREYIQKADNNEKYVSAPLANKLMEIKTQVETSQVSVRNVLGIIEGVNTKEFIVLGAHYDHMGSNAGYIWNGADDNGSGTVGVMTLAKAIIETGKKPEKTIIIALWTAEEEGLLGSQYFVRNFDKTLGNIILNVNFDMISRYLSEDQQKKVIMNYSESETGFHEMTANNLKKYNIDLDIDYQPSSNPPGGSDHQSFVSAGIPVMRFKTGHREEYHNPTDEIGTIDWDIMEKIIKISYANVWQLANTK